MKERLYRIAKANGFTKNNQIKDEQRVVLRDLDRIVGRGKGYFDKLLNVVNHRFVFKNGMPNDGERNEVQVSDVITSEEGTDNSNGWDSRRCVDVFLRSRDLHVINIMQTVYEQDNMHTVLQMVWDEPKYIVLYRLCIGPT